MGKISCEACNKKCKGQALKLPTNKYFHLTCFTCKECRKDLSTEAYFMRENSYYCRFDYMRLFLAKCAQCNEYIEDDMIKVLNKSYHARCFKCSQCKKNIEAGEKMIIKKGEKVCQKCEAEESRTQQMGELQMKVPEDSAANLTNGRAAEALADNVHQCDQKLKVNGKDEMDVARKKLAEEMTDGKSAAINSPDSDYSMELKNLTDYSMDENVLLNSEQSDVHLFSPMSLTSGYKSDLSYNQEQEKSEMNLMTDEYASYRCTSPESTFSKKSKDSTASEHSSTRKSSSTLTFGKYLKGSYLEKSQNSNSKNYVKSPSCHPTASKNFPTHFHRADGFSYTKTRNDIRKSPKTKRGGLMSVYGSKTPTPRPVALEVYKTDKQQEVIQLSKLPDGHVTDSKPIERDDFPAPPHVAAVYPHLLRERRTTRPISRSDGNIQMHSTGKENMSIYDGEDDDDELVMHRRSRLEREIQELSKMDQTSGAVQLILKDLQRKQQLPHDLDPRSASRTPSANKEPPYKTRYHSPLYASPSRDLLMRSQLHHFDDDYELKYRTVVTPVPQYPGSRPRYHKSRSSYTSRDLLASHKRPESTDGCLEHVRSAPYNSSSTAPEDYDRRECSSSVCERFSQFSSRTDLDDVPVQSGSKLNKFPRMDGRSTPISLLSHQFYSIHRSIVTSVDKDDANIKTYPYEVLKVTSLNRPAHLDDGNLEQYLEEETFEWLLGMDRAEFYHLPAWKRNDMKKRIELFK